MSMELLISVAALAILALAAYYLGFDSRDWALEYRGVKPRRWL
jgi:hypothetical protein